MKIIPRQPFDEDIPGYLESDNDFIKSNFEVVVKLLDGLTEDSARYSVVDNSTGEILTNKLDIENLADIHCALRQCNNLRELKTDKGRVEYIRKRFHIGGMVQETLKIISEIDKIIPKIDY